MGASNVSVFCPSSPNEPRTLVTLVGVPRPSMFGFRQCTFVSLCSLKAVALLRLKHGTLRELQVCDAAFPGRLRNEANHHSQISDAFGVPERVRLSFKSVSEREVWGEYTGESNPIVKIDLRDWSKLASTLIEKMPLEELRPWQIKRIAEAEASEIQAAAQVENPFFTLCARRKAHLHSFQGFAHSLRKIVGYLHSPFHRKAVRRALVACLREIPKRESSVANHEPQVGLTPRSAYGFYRVPRSHRPLVNRSPITGRLSLGCHL